ncbi:NAD-binding protein [Mycena olivaceomarginata]|nr:NAD-binding protein [Mycena olivaceomarginata]
MSSKGIAFVTGAAQGIGRGIALRLAEDGFDVAVNDIPGNSAKLDTVVAEIKQKGRESSAHLADVSEDENVKSMIEEVVKKHGGLDVMVANAGVPGPYRVQLTEVSVEQWDQVMNVNARGCFLCYKYAGLQMIKQGRGGRIIGASSIAGKKGFPLQGPYSASKFAIRGLTQAAASELGAHGITVNAYSPGAVETAMLTGATTNPQHAAALINKFKEMSPLKLVGTPEDIANLVSFLASKESQFITGQSISINGGLFFD